MTERADMLCPLRFGLAPMDKQAALCVGEACAWAVVRDDGGRYVTCAVTSLADIEHELRDAGGHYSQIESTRLKEL